MPSGRAGTAFSHGRIGARASRRCSIAIEAALARWAAAAAGEPERRLRQERLGLAFGRSGAAWNEELVLERYELLYEAGLVVGGGARPRAAGARRWTGSATGAAMALDHRRILATAIGRLRGKIKYRPVVFELMPPGFTLLQLQRTVEALAGVRLHKQNFRRLVEQQGLVEETGEISARPAAGRPASSASAARYCWSGRPRACACAPPAAGAPEAGGPFKAQTSIADTISVREKSPPLNSSGSPVAFARA